MVLMTARRCVLCNKEFELPMQCCSRIGNKCLSCMTPTEAKRFHWDEEHSSIRLSELTETERATVRAAQRETYEEAGRMLEALGFPQNSEPARPEEYEKIGMVDTSDSTNRTSGATGKGLTQSAPSGWNRFVRAIKNCFRSGG